MSQPLEDACLAIVAVVGGVTGVRQAHNYAPDTLNIYPAAVVYPGSGTFDVTPFAVRKGMHNIIIELFVPREVSTSDRQMEDLTQLIDPIAQALTNEISDSGDMFSGKINTFGSLSYSFISTNYAGVGVRGYRFVMENVKILVTR